MLNLLLFILILTNYDDSKPELIYLPKSRSKVNKVSEKEIQKQRLGRIKDICEKKNIFEEVISRHILLEHKSKTVFCFLLKGMNFYFNIYFKQYIAIKTN